MFSPEIKRIRKLILYLALLIYSLVHALRRPHDLLGYSVYGLVIFLLLLELVDPFKDLAHKGS